MVLENKTYIPYLICTQAKKYKNLLKIFTGKKLFLIQSKWNDISVADAWQSRSHYKYPFLGIDLYLLLSFQGRFWAF